MTLCRNSDHCTPTAPCPACWYDRRADAYDRQGDHTTAAELRTKARANQNANEERWGRRPKRR